MRIGSGRTIGVRARSASPSLAGRGGDSLPPPSDSPASDASDSGGGPYRPLPRGSAATAGVGTPPVGPRRASSSSTETALPALVIAWWYASIFVWLLAPLRWWSGSDHAGGGGATTARADDLRRAATTPVAASGSACTAADATKGCRPRPGHERRDAEISRLYSA